MNKEKKEMIQKEGRSFVKNITSLNTWCYFFTFLIILWGAYTLGIQQGNSDMCSSLGGDLALITKAGANNDNILCILDSELIRANQKLYIDAPQLLNINESIGLYE